MTETRGAQQQAQVIRHVILAEPLRCWAQMMTACQLAEAHGAVMHLTPGCYGEATRKRPGMGSSCMPRDPARGYGRCRHGLAVLRAEGAIDITTATPCWTLGGTCTTCGGVTRAEMAVPDEYPVTHPVPVRSAQGVLWQ
jgi:hypothetical protein